MSFGLAKVASTPAPFSNFNNAQDCLAKVKAIYPVWIGTAHSARTAWPFSGGALGASRGFHPSLLLLHTFKSPLHYHDTAE